MVCLIFSRYSDLFLTHLLIIPETLKMGSLKLYLHVHFIILQSHVFGPFWLENIKSKVYIWFQGNRVLVVSNPCQNTLLQGKEVVNELLRVLDNISVLLCDKKTKKKITNKIFTLQRPEPPSYICYAFLFPTRALRLVKLYFFVFRWVFFTFCITIFNDFFYICNCKIVKICLPTYKNTTMKKWIS